MTITIDDQIDDRELERRLRATFAAVMLLLDPPAATVGEDGDGREELAAIGVIALDPSVRRPHRRRLVAPLTVLSAAAIIALLLAVRTRAVAPGTATSNASAVPAATAPSAPAPRWYEVLRPILPDGFDQIVVTGASAEALSFRALRTSTGHVLDVVVGRGTGDLKDGPDVAKNTDEYGTWFASTSAVALATTDARYVSLTCGIVIDRGENANAFAVGVLASGFDMCDDGADRDVIGGSARWKIVATLAEHLTPAVVDAAFGTPIRANDASTVETRVREVIPGLPEIGRSIRSDGVIEHFPLALRANEPGLTTLSVVPGVYPPRAADNNPALGNSTAIAEAQAALDAVPDRASLVATDGGGVTEASQRIADATRAGDPAKVGPAGYTASCASPGHA